MMDESINGSDCHHVVRKNSIPITKRLISGNDGATLIRTENLQ